MAIGIISYSVFLWHHPLIRVARHHHLTFDGRSGLLLNLASFVRDSCLSFVTYRYRGARAPAQGRQRRPFSTSTGKSSRSNALASATSEPARRLDRAMSEQEDDLRS
jgi:peptidoglycan/LPS O-acetylase OafA/YrhL